MFLPKSNLSGGTSSGRSWKSMSRKKQQQRTSKTMKKRQSNSMKSEEIRSGEDVMTMRKNEITICVDDESV